jgi:hypothetical protein
MIHLNRFEGSGSAQYVLPGLAFPNGATPNVDTNSHQNTRDIWSRPSRLARRLSGGLVFAAAAEMAYRSGDWYMGDTSSMWLTAAAYAIGCIAVLLVCSDV